MKADVDVRDFEWLKTYTNTIGEICNKCTVFAMLLDRGIRRMRGEFSDVFKDMDRLKQQCEEDCRHLKWRYQNAIDKCGEGARYVIGTTDIEAEHKLEVLKCRVDSLQHHIRDLQIKLENAGLKTQSFALQQRTLTESCVSYIKRYLEVLEQAKNEKIK